MRQKPNIKYRKYKHFNKNKFEMEILNKVFKCNKETFQIDKFKELHTAPNNHAPLKGTVMQIEKALINAHLHVSKVS